MYSDRPVPIRNWIPNLLSSLTSPPPTCISGMIDCHREGDLDMVSTFSIRSLDSSEYVTALMVWFMQA
ncbi:hypothetical protein C1H46_020103 [Malus baccata]|uniref:Uncharacterized protein n=1 Tax=Malus baccata TaxID=106549 RepID=A0A540M713_MALBA|nr:hypothetical protein C1H46_020103 [Malus baccata]